MKTFYVNPNDLRWLRRWLFKNATCCLVVVSTLAALHTRPAEPLAAINRVDATENRVSDEPLPAETLPAEPLPAETELVLLTSRPANPVAPTGWRRTKDGWEDVSKWRPIPPPLGEIIRVQQEREPAWMQSTLAGIRGISPLAFGLFQITAIAVVVSLTRKRDRRAASTNAPLANAA